MIPEKFLYTGSPPGQINWRDRVKAGFRSAGVLISCALVACAEQINQVLPAIRQNSPLWVGVLVGTFAGVVVYLNESTREKRLDNRPPEEKK